MHISERRGHRRLKIKYALSYRRVGRADARRRKGCVRDVSAAGLYFWTATRESKAGQLLRLELSIPPRAGVLESGGMMWGYARVVRTESISGPEAEGYARAAGYGVGVQFCQGPKFSF